MDRDTDRGTDMDNGTDRDRDMDTEIIKNKT
jgi:hypothetical protein